MILNKNLLILEDDLETLSKILGRLSVIERDREYDFSVMVLSNYHQVEDYINSNSKAQFDIVLLDRDCKLGGSFHVFDIERFGADKIIAISSVPNFNEDAKRRGVTRVVLKDYQHLDDFAERVAEEVGKVLRT